MGGEIKALESLETLEKWADKAQLDASEGGSYITPQEIEKAVDIYVEYGLFGDFGYRQFDPAVRDRIPDIAPIFEKKSSDKYYQLDSSSETYVDLGDLLGVARQQAFEKLPIQDLSEEQVKGLFLTGQVVQSDLGWTVFDAYIFSGGGLHVTIVNHPGDTYHEKMFKVIAIDADGKRIRLGQESLGLLKTRIKQRIVQEFILDKPQSPRRTDEPPQTRPPHFLPEGLPQEMSYASERAQVLFGRISRYWGKQPFQKDDFVSPQRHAEKFYREALAAFAQAGGRADRRERVYEFGTRLGKDRETMDQDIADAPRFYRQEVELRNAARALPMKIQILGSSRSVAEIDTHYEFIENLLSEFSELKVGLELPTKQESCLQSYQNIVHPKIPHIYLRLDQINRDLIELGIAGGKSRETIEQELLPKTMELIQNAVQRGQLRSIQALPQQVQVIIDAFGKEAIKQSPDLGAFRVFLEAQKTTLLEGPDYLRETNNQKIGAIEETLKILPGKE